MTNAGRIGFLIKGDYDPAATYDFLDVVFYDHASYVAKKLTTGNAPVRNNEYWQVLAEGGTLTENSDISDTTITFTEAENRVNVASGDTAGTFAGKVKKFFSDLKNVAFSGKYSDLTGTPGEFSGASATLAGSSGLVPAPGAGKNEAFLRGDKTWQNLGAAAFAGLANNVLTEAEGFALDARQGKALQKQISDLNSAMQSSPETFACDPADGVVTEKNYCFYNPISRQVHILVSSINVVGEFKPGKTVFLVPQKYRPKNNIICMVRIVKDNVTHVATGTVYASGILAQNITSAGIFTSIMFLADYVI